MGICHIEKTRLNPKNIGIGCNNLLNINIWFSDLIKLSITQPGIPNINNGGDISVNNTCCSMCALNK